MNNYTLGSLRLCFGVAVGCMLSGISNWSHAGTSSERQVAVHVRVIKPGNAAVEGAAVLAGTDFAKMKGFTGEDGGVQLSGLIKADVTRLHVVISSGVQDASADENIRSLGVFRHLTEDMFMDRKKCIVLNQEQSSYSVTFEAFPSIVVRGRARLGESTFDAGLVFRRGASGPATISPKTGRFKMDGVRKDGTCDFVVLNVADGSVREERLAASQTSQDFDLGDLAVPSAPAGFATNIRVSDMANWPQGLAGLAKNVTIVSEDGLFLWNFPVLDENGKVIKSLASSAVVPTLPAGRYFVVPGVAAIDWPSLVVRDTLRQPGGLQIVQAAGMPSVSVAESNVDEAVVTVGAMLQACKVVRGF